MMIALAVVTKAETDAGITSGGSTVVTPADLFDAGLPIERVQYWAAIERRGPLVGLVNLTMLCAFPFDTTLLHMQGWSQ
jgi:hypothetical protein